MKYFIIGYNKTATTTIHGAFSKLGFKSIHNYRNWESIINEYDCFSDNGNLEDFKKLDKLCSNSIFILNVRSLDNWLLSRISHGYEEYNQTNEHNWAYPISKNVLKDWILEREQYHLEVLEYFINNPKKLIIVNIEKSDWMSFLFSNLGLKIGDKFDRYNVSSLSEYVSNYKKEIESLLKSYNYNNKNKLIIQNNVFLEKYLGLYKNNI